MEKGTEGRHRIIFCDFDGTITHQDIGNAILNHFSSNRWEILDSEFISGRIGSKDAYQKISPYLKASRQETESFIRTNFSIDAAFPLFIKLCKENSDSPIILSDGFDIYIRILLQKAGLAGEVPWRANQWVFEEGGGATFTYPYHNPLCKIEGGMCGNCKLNHLIEIQGDGREIIYIGNGYSDRCPIQKADIVLAKDHLKEHCISKGMEFTPFEDFHDVIRRLFGVDHTRP